MMFDIHQYTLIGDVGNSIAPTLAIIEFILIIFVIYFFFTFNMLHYTTLYASG